MRRENFLQIHQRQYVLDMPRKYRMEEAYAVATPMNPSVQLVKNDEVSKDTDKLLFQQILGSLQYAASATRPDIAYAVNAIARHAAQPSETHMTCLRHVLRYLRYIYRMKLVGYSDADWAGYRDDRRSTSGYIYLLSGSAVTWACRKQPSVALSTVEAEYIALSLATQEVTWLRYLLEEIGDNIKGATLINEDNQGAIATARNPVFQKRMKHMQIKYHHVREALSLNVIHLEYCRSRDMLADILTKPAARDQLQRVCELMGLMPLYK